MAKRSIPGQKRIAQNSNGGLDLKDVYYLELFNNSDSEVNARDKDIGDIALLPGTPFLLNGHPDYPFDVSFKFSFLGEGETNFITATYLRSYGNTKK